MPAATAFSMRASDIAELVPRAMRSAVNGIPNFEAISRTFSYDAFTSSDYYEEVYLPFAFAIAL